MASTTEQALEVLARLAPSGRDQPEHGSYIEWQPLPAMAVSGFTSIADSEDGRAGSFPLGETRNAVKRIGKRTRLHDDGRRLRVGWLWLIVPGDKGPTRSPLVSVPVASWSGFGGHDLVRTAPPATSDAIPDWEERARLDERIEFGGGALDATATVVPPDDLLHRLVRLQAFAAQAAAAAGHPGAPLVAEEPTGLRHPCVVAQVVLYLTEQRSTWTTVASSLQQWATRQTEGTAFAELYRADNGPTGRPTAAPSSDDNGDDEPTTPLLLTPVQCAAVQAARRQVITVVSGPPGTGKSHVVAAIAHDTVARGGSVLIGAPSEAAVEAIATILDGQPGPDPVIFGAEERRNLVDQLGQGGGRRYHQVQIDEARRDLEAVRQRYEAAASGVSDVLATDRQIAFDDPMLDVRRRQVAPSWFAHRVDLELAGELMQRACDVGPVLRSLRRRRRQAALRRHAGASPSASIEELGGCLAAARAQQFAAALSGAGPIDLSRSWDRLDDLDDELRAAKGTLLERQTHADDVVGRRHRTTMTAVSAALRSGRARRRRQLAGIDGDRLTEALPIWAGTLRDIDDLLPQTPAMFDLVIIDEASQVDQITAASALLRAERVVFVGDPKQLRFVSFIADAAVDAAVAEAGAGRELAHRLDVRRLSAFDVGAAIAPTQFLDEHFRSVPHLIDFSAQRFYDGALHVAKRHPTNDRSDRIEVRVVDGSRDERSVNLGEVDAVVELVRRSIAHTPAGETIGVIAPFRAQADAITEAIVDRVDSSLVERVALRVGTVHGFQGCERDTIIVSLTVDNQSPAGSLTFLNDPHLFNVMATRARQRCIVLHSLRDAPGGLLGEYLRHADAPRPVDTLRRSRPEIRRLADELVARGVAVVSAYPAGRHDVDLVIDAGERSLGVICGVHPDGVDAHVTRHLDLRRAGWQLRELFEIEWGDRHAELVVDLAREAADRRRAAPDTAP